MHILGPREHEEEYGYLSCHHHVVLGLNDITCLVQMITELVTPGLTSLFLFSSLTLNVNSSGFCCLIQAFCHTCVSFPVLDADWTWCEDAHFATPPS
jgi:hypothetical protein